MGYIQPTGMYLSTCVVIYYYYCTFCVWPIRSVSPDSLRFRREIDKSAATVTAVVPDDNNNPPHTTLFARAPYVPPLPPYPYTVSDWFIPPSSLETLRHANTYPTRIHNNINIYVLSYRLKTRFIVYTLRLFLLLLHVFFEKKNVWISV